MVQTYSSFVQFAANEPKLRYELVQKLKAEGTTVVPICQNGFWGIVSFFMINEADLIHFKPTLDIRF